LKSRLNPAITCSTFNRQPANTPAPFRLSPHSPVIHPSPRTRRYERILNPGTHPVRDARPQSPGQSDHRAARSGNLPLFLRPRMKVKTGPVNNCEQEREILLAQSGVRYHD
jgi:hypothetical protein